MLEAESVKVILMIYFSNKIYICFEGLEFCFDLIDCLIDCRMQFKDSFDFHLVNFYWLSSFKPPRIYNGRINGINLFKKENKTALVTKL